MTGRYVWWSLVNLVGLVFYLRHFSIALTGRTNGLKLFQWLICFPLVGLVGCGRPDGRRMVGA